MMKNAIPKPQIAGNKSPEELQPATSKAKMPRCARPLAYCPLYTAPIPNGIAPRIPATVGLGPLPLPGGGGAGIVPAAAGGNVPGTNPAEAGATVPSIRAARHSSQQMAPRTGRVQFAHSAFPQVRQ